MSLGMHSIGNGGKLPVDSGSDKSASDADKVKSDDSSKFSKAIDDQVSGQNGAEEHIGQILSNQLLLPDNGKGASPAEDGSHIPHNDDSPDFIEDLLEPGETFDGEQADAADRFTGEVRGFNVPLASFGQRATGTFSVVETHSEPSENTEVDEAQTTADEVAQDSAQQAGSADSSNIESEQADADEIEEEPSEPAGVFGVGNDMIAQFLRGDTNDSEEQAGNYFAGGFVD